MKCPDCGQEIADEYLYCEKCGMEIRIVPDFEPEIENSITETLSTVAEEIEDRKEKSNSLQFIREESKNSKGKQPDIFSEEPGNNWLMIRIASFVCIILIIIFSSIFIYFNYSVAYQVKNARENAQKGKYEEAVKYLDKAISLGDDNAELVLLQANYIYKKGDTDRAATVLCDLIETVPITQEEAEKAYTYLIAVYDEQGRYEEINELLMECQDDSIVTMFQNYMAMEPEFSYIGGSYDSVVPLKLSANTTGKIYYTLDGSTPDENSKIYTAPIFLESGTYKVTAFFVNDYGIKSKVVQNWYEINLTVPDPPQVLLYSGKYEVPTKIEVEPTYQGEIYYTTDGSAPNENSVVYKEPVEMPLGRSNFKFVVISQAGVSSEIVSRSYEFALNTDITIEKASQAVIHALLMRGVVKDSFGNAKTEEGKYIFRYDTIVEFEKNYYYVLEEFLEDTNGNQKKTGLLYAVEVYTGSPNRLIYDEQGQMGLISLSE